MRILLAYLARQVLSALRLKTANFRLNTPFARLQHLAAEDQKAYLRALHANNIMLHKWREKIAAADEAIGNAKKALATTNSPRLRKHNPN